MNRKPGREELVYSWHRQHYFTLESTREEVLSGLHRLVGVLGLEHFAGFLLRISHDRSPLLRPPATLTSYPKAWIDPYLARSFYLGDPVLHAARWSHRPFFWGPNRFLEPYTPRQRRVLEAAGAHGIRYGLGIPVHGPMGSCGVFILANGDPERLRRATQGEQDQLYAVALDVHDYLLRGAMAKVRKEEDALELRSSSLLRRREKEALWWTREGYPAKQVGRLLGLTEYTVHRYLSDAQQKLDCRTKVEAAMRAFRAGLLHREPEGEVRRRRWKGNPAGESGGRRVGEREKKKKKKKKKEEYAAGRRDGMDRGKESGEDGGD